MKIFSQLLPLAFWFFLFACSNGSDQRAPAAGESLDATSVYQDDMKAKEESLEEPEVERQLIKTGNISFETNSIEKTRTQLLQEIESLDGYISNENQYDSGDRIHYNIQVRLPAKNFDALLNSIAENATRIENQSVNVQDVTEEYIDIQSRLKTKKELEERYRELLARANSVEEILSIEREIGVLRSDIESYEGRLNYLKNQVSLSTLNVDFYQLTLKDFGFFSKIGRAVSNGWTHLLAFIVGLIEIWPFLILITLFIYLAKRFGWFSRKRK